MSRPGRWFCFEVTALTDIKRPNTMNPIRSSLLFASLLSVHGFINVPMKINQMCVSDRHGVSKFDMRCRKGLNLRCSIGRSESQTSAELPSVTNVPGKLSFNCNPSDTPPPKSFQMCVEQAYISTRQAIEDGYRLLEVEFPPLPTKALDNGALGADVILSAQIEHARDFGKLFEGKKVAIVFPDMVERNRFIQDASFSKKSPSSNIRFTALGGGYKGSLLERLWVQQEYVPDVMDEDDIFVVIGASAQELPDVRKFCESAGDRPVILFNLKLQTLRGDLGLPAFPSKELHYDWLSKALPVYHVLPRGYTRSISRPPFLINYSGCLFRTYPGKWQVLLEVPDEELGGGKYERVRLLDKRPALSEVREVLGDELQLDSLDGEEGATVLGMELKKLRSGVVVKTWWEQDLASSASDNWRS